MNIVLEAISKSGLKSQAKFAKAINRSQPYISKCVAEGRFPIAVIKDVERVTGIPRHILAPEYFDGYEPVHANYSTNSDKESLNNV